MPNTKKPGGNGNPPVHFHSPYAAETNRLFVGPASHLKNPPFCQNIKTQKACYTGV
jgi:hypothetical protein